MNHFSVYDLERRVGERAAITPDLSYTRKLLDRGVAQCAKKLGEEAIETAIAAVAEDRPRLIAEAADLIYHLLVVLEARGVLCFTAVGSIEFRDAAGQSLGEGAPFRVTCLAVQEQDVWRLRHFHGSRPQ